MCVLCIYLYRPGDVIESVNGVNLSSVDHQDAICAIKENKGPLNLVRCVKSAKYNSISRACS